MTSIPKLIDDLFDEDGVAYSDRIVGLTDEELWDNEFDPDADVEIVGAD